MNAEAVQWQKLLALQAFEAFYNANNLILKESEDADQHIQVLARKLRLYRQENEVLIKKITKIKDMIHERLKHQEKINKIIDHDTKIDECIQFRKIELDAAKKFMDLTFIHQTSQELTALERIAGSSSAKIDKFGTYHESTINRLNMSVIGLENELQRNNKLQEVDISSYSKILLCTVPEKPRSEGIQSQILLKVRSQKFASQKF